MHAPPLKLSIITPSYRQLDWLALCAASIRDQVKDGDGFHVEHIIQDGGSPEIREFAAKIQADFYQDGELIDTGREGPLHNTAAPYTVRIHSEKDQGMYDALNRGLARADGTVCAWLNSDEQYLPNTLRKVSDHFQDHPSCDVLLGDVILLDKDKKPFCYRRIMVPSIWHTRLCHLHSLSCAMFFRKTALPNPPFEARWKLIGDAVLMNHFLRTRNKIHALKKPLAAYAFTGRNLSSLPPVERNLWYKELKYPPKWIRLFVVLTHRIRRLYHGAYQKRLGDVELFETERERVKYAKGDFKNIWPDS